MNAFVVIAVLSIVATIETLRRMMRQRPSESSGHQFDPAASTRIVGAAQLNPWFRATAPLAALTVDRECVRISGSHRLVPFPTLWIARSSVSRVEVEPRSLIRVGGVRFECGDPELSGVVFGGHPVSGLRDVLSWYGWPVDHALDDPHGHRRPA